jgi:hypothetical protein
LYTEFIRGTLDVTSSGAFTYGNASDGAELQEAVWWFEQESSGDNSGLSGSLITLADNAVTSGAWSGLGNVRVMVLTQTLLDGTVRQRQDQLVAIPLPAAVWMGGSLLMCVGALHGIRRRRGAS